MQHQLFNDNLRPAAWFDGPGLRERDHVRLNAQLQRVYDFISDGYWWTLNEISKATGDPPASVSARLRDLRKDRFGAHQIDRRLRNECAGLWEYRLNKKEFYHGNKTA